MIRLTPGTEINLIESGGQTARRTMVVADDVSLIALNLTSSALSEMAKKALVSMAIRAPERFRSVESDSVRIIDRSVTLSNDGLIVGTTKMAELREVVELIPREAVREIYLESHHGSLVWTAVGAGVGFFAGLVTGLWLAEHGNGASTAVFFAFPAAGPAIGYFTTKHERREIIYRASRP